MADHAQREVQRMSRGYTLLEILVALGVAILAIGIPVLVLSASGHGFARQAVSTQSAANVDNLIDSLRASAHTAVSIYTPTSCGGGAHGDGTACTSLRFYGKDASGNPHYWGWDLSGSTLTECFSYSGVDGGCTSLGPNLRNITRFVATPTLVSSVAATLGVSAPVSKEYEMASVAADPNGRVVSGNRVMIVDVSTSEVNREIHLLQAGAPFTTSVLRGAFTAPTTQSFGSPVAFVFTSPTAAPQASSATEAGYSNFQSLPQYAAWYWNITSCLSGGTTVATIAYNPTQAGDTLNYTVSPVNAGACTVTLSTRDQFFTDSITVNTPPTPTPSPTASASAQPSGTLSFNPSPLSIKQSTTAAGSASFTAADTLGLVSSLTVASTTCNSGITQTLSSSGGTVTSSGETAPSYSCAITYKDNYGDQASLPISVSVHTTRTYSTSFNMTSGMCGPTAPTQCWDTWTQGFVFDAGWPITAKFTLTYFNQATSSGTCQEDAEFLDSTGTTVLSSVGGTEGVGSSVTVGYTPATSGTFDVGWYAKMSDHADQADDCEYQGTVSITQ